MSYDYNLERLEAYDAGMRAKSSLERALVELNKARNWGIYDMIGGGMISTLIKHSKMNKASACIEEAKRNLSAFSRELCDIEEYAYLKIDAGGFWGFADWFFDGLLADWAMQNRINDARDQVQWLLQKVNDILARLR